MAKSFDLPRKGNKEKKGLKIRNSIRKKCEKAVNPFLLISAEFLVSPFSSTGTNISDQADQVSTFSDLNEG